MPNLYTGGTLGQRVPNKSPKMTCYKCHQLGHWMALCPQDPSLKVKCQVFPHDGLTGLKWPTPASPPVTDNHLGAETKGAARCGR